MLSAAFLTPDTGFCEVLGGDLRIALKGTTDYFFRGISQTDGESAIQAGVDFEHNTGGPQPAPFRTGLGPPAQRKRPTESLR